MPPYSAPDLRIKFERTVCGCRACSQHCRIMPGCLGVGDLERIRNFLGTTTLEADHLFLASPGALVLQRGQLRRVGTIVPARKDDGSCVFLEPDGKCQVHSVSPFGCSHFDAHLSDMECQRRMGEMLWQIDKDDQYQSDRNRLLADGRKAPAPEVLRAKY